MAEISSKAFSNYFGRYVEVKIEYFYLSIFNTIMDKPISTVTYVNDKDHNIRIAFDIEKYPNKDNKGAGTATVKLYNLNEDDLKVISDDNFNSRPVKKKITITAGYSYNKNIIYSGYINTNYVEFVNNDLVLNLFCFSYDYSKKKKNPVCTYLNQTVETIFNDVCNKYGLKLNTKGVEKTKLRELLTTKISVCITDIYELMNHIKSFGLSYYIERDTIFLSSVSKTEKPKWIINKSTGLLAAPTVLDAGIELETLLDPRLQMFDKIKIESEFAGYKLTVAQFTDTLKKLDARFNKDFYRNFYNVGFIYYLTHTGDTHSNEWKTKIRTITLKDLLDSMEI